MIRRSFRIGLLLGAAAGLLKALGKLLQGRQEQPPDSAPRPWSPLDDQPSTAGDGQSPIPAAPRAAPGPEEPGPAAAAATATDVIEQSEAAPVAEPLDGEPLDAEVAPPASEPAQSTSVPPEPVAPVEKSVAPPVGAPPRKAATRKAAAKKTGTKAAKKSTTTRKAAKKAADAPADGGSAGSAWVEPQDGVCPTSHPVKAKLSSKLFHLPGMFAYDRTNPDRCYRDAVAAEADGLRPAKR